MQKVSIINGCNWTGSPPFEGKWPFWANLRVCLFKQLLPVQFAQMSHDWKQLGWMMLNWQVLFCANAPMTLGGAWRHHWMIIVTLDHEKVHAQSYWTMSFFHSSRLTWKPPSFRARAPYAILWPPSSVGATKGWCFHRWNSRKGFK